MARKLALKCQRVEAQKEDKALIRRKKLKQMTVSQIVDSGDDSDEESHATRHTPDKLVAVGDEEEDTQ